MKRREDNEKKRRRSISSFYLLWSSPYSAQTHEFPPPQMSLPAKISLSSSSSSSFSRGPSCPRKETRRRQLSRRWSRLVSLSSLSVPSSSFSFFALPLLSPSCPPPVNPSRWCISSFLREARNRYRGSPHKYSQGVEARGTTWKEGEGWVGEGKKGEPTNCYTALWCHSGLLRHGPGISPEWCMRESVLFYFVVSPPSRPPSVTVPPRGVNRLRAGGAFTRV